ncbi:MAG: hypothetical protein GXY86_03590 [Firmicutes bacterium]|nr:hypothetical protein [Bacillota bacterium]
MANLPILYRIQEIHNRQKAVEKSIAVAEQSPDLNNYQSLKVDYQKKLTAIIQKQESTRKRQQQLDLELKSCLEKIRQEEAKLYGGSVVNSRELEQIQLKVAEYNNTKAQIEESMLQTMEEEEKLAKFKERVIEADRENGKKLEILEAQIKERVFENKLELIELDSELNELIPSVPEEWLKKLAKIAGSHNGVGIAQIKSGCCGACHVSLPESLLQRAKRGEDQILLCENCGRIIFY